MKIPPLRHRHTLPFHSHNRRLQALAPTRTFSAINTHPSTRFQVGSSNSSSSIGSLSLYRACRTRTWQTCNRPTRSTTWMPQRISSGRSSTTCHLPRTRSFNSIFNNNSRLVSSMPRRVSTVLWATRTRTGTGSFHEEKVMFDFLISTAAGQALHACERNDSLMSSIDFLLVFSFVVQHTQHMIPLNV